MIRLEAPGIETDRHVIGERVGAGKIEIDQPGQSVTEEEHVVGEQIGVDHAVGQITWPGLVERVKLLGDLRAQAGPHAVAALLGLRVERAPALDRQRVRPLVRKILAGEMQARQRLAHRRAMTGVRPADPQSVEKGDDRRRPAGEFAEHPALAVLHRLRAGDAARREMFHQA